ncbi:MAG: MoxR family ATPase [Acidimicrobiales bacterium]|nr:MoxR family ATPase [Acidimicrobiales bacterium]
MGLSAKERMTTTSSSDTETFDPPGVGSGSGGLGPSAISHFVTAFDAIAHNMETVVRGKPVVVRQALLCLLAQGHLLVEDVPGVGKTTVAKALAQSIDAKWGRIQFTADLLPADVTGLSIWKRDSATFEFRKGPIFNNIVLADEINRSSPKTQSALLEAMAEEQVTVDGHSYQLPEPFMVVATQNPVESEGTYPLPESQLDRFLMRISVGYPRRTDELSILETHEQRHLVDALNPVATAKDLVTMINMVKKVTIAPELRGYLVDLAEATRIHPSLELGMSPRATLSLQQVSRAHALASQRAYVIDDDIKAVASSVISHRLMLRPEAELQGTDTDRVVADVLDSVPVPYDRM